MDVGGASAHESRSPMRACAHAHKQLFSPFNRAINRNPSGRSTRVASVYWHGITGFVLQDSMGQGGDEGSASGEGGSQGSTASRKLIDLRDCLADSPRFR